MCNSSPQASIFPGLDPARPYFNEKDPAVRLDPADAEYVDVIHTNAPNVGTPQSVGNIDFWPNGGYLQPGCLHLYQVSEAEKSCKPGNLSTNDAK